MRFHNLVSPLAILLVVGPAIAAPVTLTGQVTYRERVALPEQSSLNIRLIDQTLPGIPPRLEVEAPIGHGQVPLGFTLTFEDSLILPGHSYALTTSIRTPDGVLFRNSEPYALDPLAPVEPVLVVTSPVVVANEPAAPADALAPPPAPAILDKTWFATSIAGESVLPRATPTLTIGADRRAGGIGGCNSWFAQAQFDDRSLRLGSITSTQKGCTQSVNLQEQAYRDALAATTAWEVSGDELTLFGADGKPLLVFHR